MATRLMAFRNALRAGFDAVGRDAAAAVDLAVVLDFDVHFGLGVFADGDRLHAEVAADDRARR